MNLDSLLADKVAIVTGSGTGIGQGIALGLAKAGADIVVAEMDKKTAAITAKEIRSYGRKAIECVVDVQDNRQVDILVQQAVTQLGHIDILVNNAGGLGGRGFLPALDVTEEIWMDIFYRNVKTTFSCTRAVGKVIIDQKRSGSIINIGSLAGFSNCPGQVHYGAMKGAIHSFTHGLAREWAQYGIRVNAIAPGLINTPGRTQAYQNAPQLWEIRDKMIPVGRPGQPSELASVAVFLATDASSYITGQVILVSGGLDHLASPWL
ncbi:SDR family NAD(P)-dependent oxidoreductase [Chloroflexota bacterium]